MAYCRKGPDSDLYVIGTGDGYECLCCPLTEEITVAGGAKMHDSRYFRNISHLYSHLLDHVGAGHKVPQEALDRVECEERGVEYVDPELLLWRLCERLSAPNAVFSAIVQAGQIIRALDALSDESQSWEFFDIGGDRDPWYEGEEWNQP